MLANSGFQIALGYVVRRRWKALQDLVRYCLVNEKSKAMRNSYIANARAKANQRLERGADVERFDFFSHLLREKAPEANIEFFASQGTTLVAAGTETTSTFMSALTYYLLRYPQALERLQEELRHTFRQHSEIDGETTKSLKYLNAVIEEGMRVFAPAPFGLPRVSPGAKVTGEWIPKGVSQPYHNSGSTVLTCSCRRSSQQQRMLLRVMKGGFTQPRSFILRDGCPRTILIMRLSSMGIGKRPRSPFLWAHGLALEFTSHTWKSEFASQNLPGVSTGNK